LLGTALALLNFGIDEFVNPRLRSTGVGKVRTADGHKVRMKVGFTPVLMARTSTTPTPVRSATPATSATSATPVTPVTSNPAAASNPPGTSNTPVPSKGTDQ
jgi:peptide/nickel transport system permease protein